MSEKIMKKLQILADSAKYDVSCSSSGSKRKNTQRGLGNTNGMGICHSFTEDGRCVSLLKILLTNHCIYDCAYCVSRRSNDVQRVAFTVEEVVSMTMHFYRRNYIEGLFLSSGIFKNSDYTMERLVRIAKTLRTEHKFNGYIHLKTIPGASNELVREAGLYADRLSVNVELPTEQSLVKLAPEKNTADIVKPMSFIRHTIEENRQEIQLYKHAPAFVPAGQSTQMIIGASPESDWQIMQQADSLYKKFHLKRVYYSAYVPVQQDQRLPDLHSLPPVQRENRLYQTDWLLRFYGFSVNEIFNPSAPNLETDVDPKLTWALRNLHLFPVDINRADYEMILRIPGLGVKSAKKIVAGRKFHHLTLDHLRQFGVALNRARYFLICIGWNGYRRDWNAAEIKRQIIAGNTQSTQLSLF
ncbi:putative DNA modification/repair radical SAM protein [Cytophagaceae bacterium YF14B1]|uniref:DNA modification/repair radical SAM protein n=1 Tax=Xanthocytophaga flava TaxID=3048013 RepID=A0AAE3QYZ7_9BACT|nr:putative DNA modification/repair radical SAM protein [Xanthocytophaga flavus]MDJ1485334.1 putative DNA modification/repair radical SAM protein [Xanthocytophaga flavus]